MSTFLLKRVHDFFVSDYVPLKEQSEVKTSQSEVTASQDIHKFAQEEYEPIETQLAGFQFVGNIFKH